MRVLIAGCGEVGGRLGKILLDEGHEVWGLRRRPDALPPGIQPIAADLGRPETLGGLPAGLNLVFYTAAADSFGDEAYHRAYVQGSRNLLSALVAAGQQPRRVFFASSTSVYPQSDGQWVDEESPADPEHFAGRRVRAGEKLWLGGPFPATAVRLGGLYGPGRTRLLDQLRRGEATCVESPRIYTNRIRLEDAAGALAYLSGLPEARSIYVAVDSDPAPQCRVLRWLAQRLGVAPPRVVTAEEQRSRGERSNKRCSNHALLETGYVLRYRTFREGYGDLLRRENEAG